ncbi:cholinesterase-like [Saccoglossus kowalevskii]|uniref:Carboxylic ester hydrolase n=1 Tax=Saccoglossus kowalevskii TaxID=10224 RepID=A0ABM0H0Z2_SACKO|nr:PREDICTED: acetylcholinesterase-like [Saccoglossus kowalevskii]
MTRKYIIFDENAPTIPNTDHHPKTPNCEFWMHVARDQTNGQLGPIIRINHGQLEGKRTEILGKMVDHFLGIPFAEPPVGDMRFRPPTPLVSGWDSTRDATKFGEGCWQMDDLMFGDEFRGSNMWNANVPVSEDCLFLNVWTPYPRPLRTAVMVWIYGGAFVSGTASLDVYNGQALAAMENVVVVSMNYRVGALGFLSLMDPEIPGNMGFMDQALSLQWVRDNIEAFGGDPYQVTIFGESAGGVSVGMHLMSPMSQHLFQRAILQSGTPLSPWATLTEIEAIDRAKEFANNLGCQYDEDQFSASELTACFLQKDAEEIYNAQWVGNSLIGMPFMTVVDGVFLTQTPQNLMKDGLFKNVPILLGSNKDEGTWFLPYHFYDLFSLDDPAPLDKTTFQRIIKELYISAKALTRKSIAFEYTDWYDPDNADHVLKNIANMLGDSEITCPTVEFAKLYAGNDIPVFLYHFTHRSTNNPWPEWYGCLHGDEIAYVFGLPRTTEDEYHWKEEVLSRRIMKHWTNFAKTGDPNKEMVDDEVATIWPPYTLEDQEYILLNVDTNFVPEARSRLRGPYCEFWKEMVPSIQTLPDIPTCSAWSLHFSFIVSQVSFTLTLILSR